MTLGASALLLAGLTALTLGLTLTAMWSYRHSRLRRQWSYVLVALAVAYLSSVVAEAPVGSALGTAVGMLHFVSNFLFVGLALFASGTWKTPARPAYRRAAHWVMWIGLALFAGLLVTQPDPAPMGGGWYRTYGNDALLPVFGGLLCVLSTFMWATWRTRRDHAGLIVAAASTLMVPASWMLAPLFSRPLSAATGADLTAMFGVVAASTAFGLGAVMLALEEDHQLQGARLKQRRRHDSLESLGQFAATVTHDINNLLLRLECGLELARSSDDPGEVQKVLDDLEGVVRHGSEMTRALTGLAVDGTTERRTVALKDWLMAEQADLARLTGLSGGLHVEVPRRVAPILAMGKTPLRQLFLNLLFNAAEAAGTDARVSIQLSHRRIRTTKAVGAKDLDAGSWVRICVEDNGPGFTDHALDRAFEPLFTTRGADGTGIGLTSVRRIAEDLGGAATAENHRGGARIVVWLPTLNPAPTRRSLFARLPAPQWV